MSVEALAWAWKQKLSPNEKLLLLAIADHSDNTGICWPGIQGLMEKTGMSKRNIHYALKKLSSVVGLKTERRTDPYGRSLSNLYLLPIEPSRVQGLHPGVQKEGGEGATVAHPYLLESSNRTINKEESLPEWLDKQVWEDFKEHRKNLKAKLSDLATKRLFNQLETFHNSGFDVSEIINRSIMNGWKGLFPPSTAPSKNDSPMQRAAKSLKEAFG